MKDRDVPVLPIYMETCLIVPRKPFEHKLWSECKQTKSRNVVELEVSNAIDQTMDSCSSQTLQAMSKDDEKLYNQKVFLRKSS